MKRIARPVMLIGLMLMPVLAMAQEHEHAEAVPTGISWYVWFHLVNLTILLIVLYRLLRQPLRDYLVRRQDTIREALERAENARKEAAHLSELYRARLAGLSEEIASLRIQAESSAKAESAQLIASAQAAASRIESDSQRLLKDELFRARYQLRQEAIELAIKLAESLLSSQTTDADQRRLAEDYLRRVGQSTEIH